MLKRHGYLLIALPGILILVVAVLLFESSSNMTLGDFAQLIQSLIDLPHLADAAHILIEVKTRFIWLSTVLLNVSAAVYAFVLCGLIVYRAHPRKRLLVVTAVGIVLCAGGLLHLVQSAASQNVLYRAVFGFTFLTLQGSGRFSQAFLERVHTIIVVVNVLAVVVPVMAVLAACSILAPPADGRRLDLEDVTARMRTLKEVLNAGSAILVSGVLHMGAWLRWPASLVDEEHVQEAVSGVSLAITLFWGITFTLMLVATYGPAAAYLGSRARELLHKEPYVKQISDPEQWLKNHGLYFTLSEQLPQFAVMLAPLLAGPIGSLLMAPIGTLGP